MFRIANVVDNAPRADIRTSAAVPVTVVVPRTIRVGPKAAAIIARLSFIGYLTVVVALLLV